MAPPTFTAQVTTRRENVTPQAHPVTETVAVRLTGLALAALAGTRQKTYRTPTGHPER